jgi:hypothetical protein
MKASISTIQPISQLPLTFPDENSQSSIEMVPSMEISPALATTDDELACVHITRYILNSHKQLTTDDIGFAINYISSFYSYSLDILKDNPDADNILTEDQLIMFLVYADQRGICKFALIFNETLDLSIKNKNTTELKNLLLGPKDMFIELYDNTFLRNEDREFTIRLISREMFALKLAIGLIKKKVLETFDDKCASESMTVIADKEGPAIQITSLATRCYDEVCIQDAKILEDDMARAAMSKYEKPAETVYTVDKSSSTSIPRAYCFETIELIAAVVQETPINPKTKEQFSEYSLKLIQQRFHKEIAMYRRYKQIKSAKA